MYLVARRLTFDRSKTVIDDDFFLKFSLSIVDHFGLHPPYFVLILRNTYGYERTAHASGEIDKCLLKNLFDRFYAKELKLRFTLQAKSITEKVIT